MKLNIIKPIVITVLFFVWQQSMASETFFTARCKTPFPESMSSLQEFIIKQGYVISRVQHVDKGLKARGYDTGLYRIVFFGKKDEIHAIQNNYPALIPYIPLNITIFEDGTYTGISTIDPMSISNLYQSKKIKLITKLWHKDIFDIFNNYKHCSF